MKIKIFISIALFLSSIFFLKCNNSSNNELILADASVVWWMAPGIITKQENLYEKNDLKIKSFDVQTGLASKNSVISGDADVGLVASTPLALGAFTNENLIILCSYIESSSLIALLSTSEESDTSKFKLPTPPVAIVKGTISELFFYNYMERFYPGIKIDNQLNVKPSDISNAMKNGDSKSCVIWEPFATMIATSNIKFKVNRPEDLYTQRLYIVTRPEVLKEKRKLLQKFVKSFDEACFILNNDPKGIQIVKDAFPQQTQSLNELWNKVNFSIKYDYNSMADLIIKESETLHKLGLTPKDEHGNYRVLTKTDIEYLFAHDFKVTGDE